jgi:WD40 repeat protein/serine/threonine protein kinase
MNPQKTCKHCGTEIPPSQSRHLCPACLFDLALSAGGDWPAKTQSSDDESASNSAATFGEYDLLGELGRGGQGIVHRARHRGLRRIVALKTIPPSNLGDSRTRERFLLEASTASRLDHPNLVPIYEVGEEDGFCFYTMKLIEGSSIERLIPDGPPDAEGCRHIASILGKVAQAVHHAHQRGILHRDLKPSNILLDQEDEPHVTDFGMAREIGEPSALTVTQGWVGTPAYLAPEVIASGSSQATIATDIYGLGAILYYTLTGDPPFSRTTLAATLHAAQTEEVPPATRVNSAIPRDLETICLKCLEKDPTKRYQSAEQVAEELTRFLNDEPIQARPISRTEKTARWCRRKPALAASLSLILILTLILIIGSPIAILRVNRARETTELNLYAADMNLASQALENHDLRGTRELLEKHWPLKSRAFGGKGGRDLRGWEWRYLYGQCHSDELAALPPCESPVLTARLSPDGRLIAAIIATGEVHIWDFATRQEKMKLQAAIGGPLLGINEICHILSFSPDSKTIAAYGTDHQIRIWELASGKELYILPGYKDPFYYIAFSPDGKMLGIASGDALRLWALQGGKPRLLPTLEFSRDAGGPMSLAFAPNGQLLASGSKFGHLYLWDISKPQSPRELWRLTDEWMVFDIKFSPDGKTLALLSQRENGIRMIEIDTGRELMPLRGHGCIINEIAFSPDGTRIASAGNDWNISVWDLSGHKDPITLKGHEDDVISVAFSPDGKTLLSGSFDKTVRLWDVSGGQSPAHLGKWAPDVPFSPDSKYIVTWDWLNHLALWDAVTGREVVATNVTAIAGGDVRWAGNSKSVFLRHAGTTQKLEIPSLRLLAEYPGNRRFAADESFSIYISDNRVVREESTGGERILGTVRLNGAFDLSPSGAKVACGVEVGGSFGVMIFETGKSAQPLLLKGHTFRVYNLAFSPDEKLLATASWDSSVGLWDLSTGKNKAFLRGHTGFVWNIAFAPDGRSLASCGDDTTIRFWNLASLQEAGTIHPNKAQVASISFSSDGKHLASGGGGELKIWHAPSLEEIDQKKKGLK